MFTLTLTEGIVLSILGTVIAIVLLVIDKANLLKGSMLLILLAVATMLALPLLLSIRWVAEAQGQAKFSRVILMVFILGVVYSLLAVWVSSAPTKIDPVAEIKQILERQDQFRPEVLLERYPLGYVIYELGYNNHIVPYAQRKLDDYEFDWKVARILRTTDNQVEIILPNIRNRANTGARINLDNSTATLRKQAGAISNLIELPDIGISVEVVAVRETGIVFLIGFKPGGN